MKGTLWTDERTADLKRMWAQGLSATQIAYRLGLDSRSAVLGKVHRLKLAERRTGHHVYKMRPAHVPPRPAAKAPRVPRPVQPMPLPLPGASDLAPTCQLQGLTGTTCRWPIGDPREPGFGFCGRPHVPGLPYCEYHARRAFRRPGEDR
jgi:GcrA cell cycle regulator